MKKEFYTNRTLHRSLSLVLAQFASVRRERKKSEREREIEKKREGEGER